MIRIAKSLITIVAVAAVAVGATGAYFSSSVDISDNTFSTGTLEIRINGVADEIDGVSFGPAAPGACSIHTWTINNYGAPWFAGPSNLPAKQLTLALDDINDEPGMSTELFNALNMKIEVNRGWPTWMQVYDGPANGFTSGDLLNPRWTELVAGNSEELKATVCLPDSGDQSDLMGLTSEWDFIVEGRTS
jgi:predicted ribosomally synthesized peptide with SipW-like signal peptide